MKPVALFLSAGIMAASVADVSAKVLRDYSVRTTGGIVLTVDSIDYRNDLTRVYGKLIGKPHTSNRIDRITLLSASRSLQATDIDGIDFKRWFQWEDSGMIPVEIDFGKLPATANFELNAVCGKGDCKWKVSKRNSKKRVSKTKRK